MSTNSLIPVNIYYDPNLALHVSKGWERSAIVSGKVQTVSGQRFSVNCHPDETISSVIEKIMSSEKSSGASSALSGGKAAVALHWGCTKLASEATVRQCRLNAGCTLVAESVSDAMDIFMPEQAETSSDGRLIRPRSQPTTTVTATAEEGNNNNNSDEKNSNAKSSSDMGENSPLAEGRNAERNRVLRAAEARMRRSNYK